MELSLRHHPMQQAAEAAALWCVLGTSAIGVNLGLAYTSARQPKFSRPEDT